MIICQTIAEVKSHISNYRMEQGQQAKVGFVPTMGFLHEGHASLLRRSKQECGLTVLSIFVNPLQFGPNEDFDRYPRDEERDLQVARQEGADVVFIPSVNEMYPVPAKTRVLVSGVTERLCGASRPGHFDGVGTVVSKLFHIVGPDRAYFGLKDAQQVAVITTMVRDLNMPVEIVPCETVREQDGLALSSRNVYLGGDERGQAVVLSQALALAGQLAAESTLGADELQRRLSEYITAEAPLAVIDYVEILSYPDLEQLQPGEPLGSVGGSWIVALAVKFGTTRLIDNRLFWAKEVSSHV